MRRGAVVKTYFTEPEKARLYEAVSHYEISASEFLRRLATGAALPDPARFEAATKLVKVNADLARFGNLLMMGLTDETLDRDEANKLLRETRDLQGEMRLAIKELRTGRERRRRTNRTPPAPPPAAPPA